MPAKRLTPPPSLTTMSSPKSQGVAHGPGREREQQAARRDGHERSVRAPGPAAGRRGAPRRSGRQRESRGARQRGQRQARAGEKAASLEKAPSAAARSSEERRAAGTSMKSGSLWTSVESEDEARMERRRARPSRARGRVVRKIRADSSGEEDSGAGADGGVGDLRAGYALGMAEASRLRGRRRSRQAGREWLGPLRIAAGASASADAACRYAARVGEARRSRSPVNRDRGETNEPGRRGRSRAPPAEPRVIEARLSSSRRPRGAPRWKRRRAAGRDPSRRHGSARSLRRRRARRTLRARTARQKPRSRPFVPPAPGRRRRRR